MSASDEKPEADELTMLIYGDPDETALERWLRENAELVAYQEQQRQEQLDEVGPEETPEDMDPLEILIRREEAGEFRFSDASHINL